MDDATKRKHQPAARPARRKVVEEPFDPAPPPSAAAALPSHLVGAIVEKGFSAAAPSSTPRPTVLPFPVARHRSHGPHWNPAAKDAGKAEDGMDVDETDYQPVAAAAGPIRRKERKGMDLNRWREFVADDAPPKRRLMQVDVRDDSMKAGGAGVVELRGEDMQLDGGEPSLAAEINSENMARLAGMSAGEIVEAQADILNRMDPTLVEMLRQRGKERSGGKKGGGKDKGGEISRPGKTARTMPGD